MTDKEIDAIYYAKRHKWFWLEMKINTLHDLTTKRGKERPVSRPSCTEMV